MSYLLLGVNLLVEHPALLIDQARLVHLVESSHILLEDLLQVACLQLVFEDQVGRDLDILQPEWVLEYGAQRNILLKD